MHHDHPHSTALDAANLGAPCSLDLAPRGTAGAAGLRPPTNDDAPGVQAKGIKGQAKTDKGDCEAAPGDQQAIDVEAKRKRFNVVRARLLLVGCSSAARKGGARHAYYEDRDGGRHFLGASADLMDLADLIEAEAFAARRGAGR